MAEHTTHDMGEADLLGRPRRGVPRIVGLAVDEPTLLGLLWVPAVLLAFAAVHLLVLGAAAARSIYKPWSKTWLSRRADAGRQPEPKGRGRASMIGCDGPSRPAA
jgi:hypothetical protein